MPLKRLTMPIPISTIRKTKETIYLADPMYTGETDEELAELIENSLGRFLRFPTKYDIHEYSIMQSFIEDMPDGAARREFAFAIRVEGAFRRFKNGIRYHGIEEAFYHIVLQDRNCLPIAKRLEAVKPTARRSRVHINSRVNMLFMP